LPRLIQALVGWATVWVCYRSSQALGRLEGVAAAFLVAAYRPFIFYETISCLRAGRSGFSVRLFTPCSWLYPAAEQRRGLSHRASSSFLVVRDPHGGLLHPVAWGWWILRRHGKIAEAVKPSSIRQWGDTPSSSWPVARSSRLTTVRNYRLTGEIHPISAGRRDVLLREQRDLQWGFAITRDVARATMDWASSKAYAERLSGIQDMTPSQVSSFWFQQALNVLAKDPVWTLKLVLKKELLFFNQFELPNLQNIEYEKRFFENTEPSSSDRRNRDPSHGGGIGLVGLEEGPLGRDLAPAHPGCGCWDLLRQRQTPTAGRLCLSLVGWVWPRHARQGRFGWKGTLLGVGDDGLAGGVILERLPVVPARDPYFIRTKSALLCMSKGDYAGAIEIYEEALSFSQGKDPMVMNNLAYAIAKEFRANGRGTSRGRGLLPKSPTEHRREREERGYPDPALPIGRRLGRAEALLEKHRSDPDFMRDCYAVRSPHLMILKEDYAGARR